MASNNQSRRIQGFWSNFQNQRQFLDDLALKLGIKEKKDWGSISTKVITANGGRTLLNHHNGSLYRALKHVYKETNWQPDWFAQISRGYWNEKKNQRNFFDKLSNILGIRNPSQWTRITTGMIRKKGGNTILNIYGGNLQRALSSVYPEIPWALYFPQRSRKIPKVPRFKEPTQNTSDNSRLARERKLYDEIAKERNIEKPEEWSRVGKKEIIEKTGGKILSPFRYSRLRTLSRVYPDIEWKREWFRYNSIWNVSENRKKLLEKVAKENNVKNPEDWGIIKIHQIIDAGGGSIFESIVNSQVL